MLFFGGGRWGASRLPGRADLRRLDTAHTPQNLLHLKVCVCVRTREDAPQIVLQIKAKRFVRGSGFGLSTTDAQVASGSVHSLSGWVCARDARSVRLDVVPVGPLHIS